MRATLIFVGAGLLALSGCAPQFDRIEEGVLRNGQEIERLQREQALLRLQVEAIDTLLRFDQDAGLTADARGSAKLGHLFKRRIHRSFIRIEGDGFPLLLRNHNGHDLLFEDSVLDSPSGSLVA